MKVGRNKATVSYYSRDCCLKTLLVLLFIQVASTICFVKERFTFIKTQAVEGEGI